MDEPYLGEIRLVSFDFAPKNYAFCNGQLLSVSQNQALFSLLGVTFGGNGVTTFALPDLRSRVPVGAGVLPSGSSYQQGDQGGAESVTLTQGQLPTHSHAFAATLKTADSADEQAPGGQYPAKDGNAQFASGPANTTMGAPIKGTSDVAGASQPHENRPPVLAMNYVIALVGNWPPRT
ncbi:tail fiber protein [Hymenobacter ginsengisoli]|uniref:Tail fiber protein n=1 Tax=Hymenobacter ginsengisoli TaxID=1051626 RepID=A0ABP8QGW0_9BACT|nr:MULTISPECIES: tail fiber protein [unclassified Hymenobacter]MBO2029971.1 phage tail protein [Hymenobacter sp. BT559]